MDSGIYGSAFLAAKLSRRTVLKAGVGAAVATVAPAASRPGFGQSSGSLNLFTWEGYAVSSG